MELIMNLKEFYDKDTYTLTYLLWDEETKEAIIIDPVLNFDQASGKIHKASLNTLTEFIDSNKLNPTYSLETHAHADHLSSAKELKKIYPNIKIGIGENIKEVQSVFKPIFNLKDLNTDGDQFDILLKEGEEISIGKEKLKVIFTPGHTPACASYYIAGMVFTGDALFMPDYGTGRCDFPKGSAKDLYNSVHNKLYNLPDDTKVYTGHDYQPGGRELKFETTIKESKESNIQLKANTSEAEYIEFRTSRDKTLNAPKLLLPSIQVNIDAGELPKPESNGKSYLKTPINFE